MGASVDCDPATRRAIDDAVNDAIDRIDQKVKGSSTSRRA
jgi:hypothetical protein